MEKGFFTAPASTKYHGNYEGGLFDHSYMVAHYLKKLTEECRLDWQNPRSPLLVGMFHDLCKMDNYQHPVIAETLGGEGNQRRFQVGIRYGHSAQGSR